jgi:hypothetical protein
MKINDIDTILEKWEKNKEHIKKAESNIEKYKKIISKYMENNDTNTISGNKYSITKRKMTKRILTKNDIDEDTWYKYSRSVNYPAFYIKEN